MSVTATENAAPARAQNSFLLHLALSAISVAQPLYSVTGTTLNFFVAWRMTSAEFILCILLVYIAPPLVTWLLVRLGYLLHRHLGRGLLFLALWFYLSLTCLMAARQLARSLTFAPGNQATLGICVLLLIVSACLAALLLARPKIRGFVRFFAVTTVVFPAAIMLHAHDLGVIRLSEVPPAEKITTADRPNVILIIYDELPVTTILDANGLIDRNKFPNFYQFAQGATWFADARSASAHTEAAVPAILAGRMRKHEVPATYRSYPENIFHRLGPSYNVLDLQFATDLNPAKPLGWQTEAPDGRERLGRIALDIAIIFGHVVAPPQLAADLPRIDLQHNRFGEDAHRSPHGIRHHEKFVAALAGAEQPLLAIYHTVYPHNRWSHYPSGRDYPDSRWGDYLSLTNRKDAKLGDDNVRVMHDYSAHLLQSMHADKLLGDLLAQIRANGQYDHSIVVVVADHGVSLWPGERPRAPSEFRLPDVQAIPLIIKLPGQTRAGISLDPVHTVDIYPTILDYLGVTIPESLQGKSLIKIIRDAAPAETVKSTPHRDDPTLKRRLEWFGEGTSMADLYGLGKFSRYMGRRVDELQFTRLPDAAVHLFDTRFNRAGPQLSLRIDAQINGGAQSGETRNILVALGDRICGATQTTDLEVSGAANSFTLVVAEECVDLLNKGIRVFIVGAEGQLAEVPVEGEPPTAVATIDRTLAGLAELIGSLQRAGEAGQGRAELGALRERGVAVPELFVRDGRLATLWGDVVLTRNGQNWVVDLYAPPKDVCKAIYLGANTIPGVARIAASASARDETNIPVTAAQADLACSNTESDIVRIITAEARAPVDRSPLPVPIDQLLAQLAEFIGALEKASASAEGRKTLPALRQLGVAVPAGFARNGELAWPWGEATLARSGREWILDLYSAPKEVCKAIYLGANTIPGVARIAASALARDETNIPVTAVQADLACSNTESDIVRIIAAEARARVDRAPPPASIDQLLAQLAAFIGALEKAPASAEGRITLPALRQLGVAVPAGFAKNGELAWPWGETILTRSGREWILDLYSAPKEVCKAIQLAANEIPAIGRIATSHSAKDELVIPVTAERAEAACSNRESGVIRIITTDTSMARLSMARLALDKLAAVWRRLKRTFGDN
jgi:hypothetical protein